MSHIELVVPTDWENELRKIVYGKGWMMAPLPKVGGIRRYQVMPREHPHPKVVDEPTTGIAGEC